MRKKIKSTLGQKNLTELKTNLIDDHFKAIYESVRIG